MRLSASGTRLFAIALVWYARTRRLTPESGASLGSGLAARTPCSGACSKLFPVLLLFFTSTSVMAQVAGTAALTGAVTDPSGAIVVGAEVTATNLATGAKRSATTDASGKYQITQVQPGDYRVDVTATGFKTAVRPRVALPIGITTDLDIAVELGDLAEQVEVQAVAAAVNTTDASMGTPLTAKEIRSLPSLDLNPAGLLSLQTGVAFVPGAADTPGGYGGVSDVDGRSGAVNGARSDQTNITLDGVDCNDPVTGYAFNCVLRATQASLAEFRTTTSNYGAEAGGRSGAAQVQLITASGQNTPHGSGYYALRHEGLNANDFFLNKSGILEPKFRRHIYGGSLGGPLLKNRLFLFGNFERMTENLFKSAVRNIPSLSFRDGVMIYQCQDLPGYAPCPGSPTTVIGASGNSYTVPAGSYGLSPAQISAIDPLGNRAQLGHAAVLVAVSYRYQRLHCRRRRERCRPPLRRSHRQQVPHVHRQDRLQRGQQSLLLRARHDAGRHGRPGTAVSGRRSHTVHTDGQRRDCRRAHLDTEPRIVNNFRYGYTRIKVNNLGITNAEFANVASLMISVVRRHWRHASDLDSSPAYANAPPSRRPQLDAWHTHLLDRRRGPLHSQRTIER